MGNKNKFNNEAENTEMEAAITTEPVTENVQPQPVVPEVTPEVKPVPAPAPKVEIKKPEVNKNETILQFKGTARG